MSSWKGGRVGLSSSLDASYLCCFLLLAPFCESTLEGEGRGQSWWGGHLDYRGTGVSHRCRRVLWLSRCHLQTSSLSWAEFIWLIIMLGEGKDKNLLSTNAYQRFYVSPVALTETPHANYYTLNFKESILLRCNRHTKDCVCLYVHTHICTHVYGLNVCNLMILEINVLLIHPWNHRCHTHIQHVQKFHLLLFTYYYYFMIKST